MAAMPVRTSLSMLLLLGLLVHTSAQAGAAAAPVVAAPQAAAPPVVVASQAAAPIIATGAATAANASAPGASACPAFAQITAGTEIILEDYSIPRQMSIMRPGGNASLGSISSPVYSYALNNDLKTTTGSLVAKVVSPTVFWDTTANLYDCMDDPIAEIKWSAENILSNIWNPGLRIYKIFDASGTQVATMEKVGDQNGKTHVMGLKVNGVLVIQFNFEAAGFTKSLLGLFGHFSKATVSFMQVPITTVVPPLLNDPRFLSLVAASELAHGNLGPFFTVLFWALPFACCFLFCCCSICGKKKDASVRPVEMSRSATAEERSRLMGPGEAGMKEAAHGAQFAQPPPKPQGGFASLLNCCSRAAPPAGHGMAPV